MTCHHNNQTGMLGTMESSMKEKGAFDEIFHGEQEEGHQEVLFGSLEREAEIEVSATEDEEEGSTPLIAACRKGLDEVIQQFLEAGADMTLCDLAQQTVLHLSPPELQGKLFGWMSRPHLPRQAQLLQAAWQGDLQSLQLLLAQADAVDVNAPNSDGVTAVMLAVRDIDLFENLEKRLPWEHRPVEVVRELLGLSVDLQVIDQRGYSALHYAANINSPLRDEIIHMMVEALGHTDASTISSPALEKYSCQDLHSEFGDSEVELDLESISPYQSTASSLSQTSAHQLYSHRGEVLDPQGYPLLSGHHKTLSQDKGIPLCFQSTMETLVDIRQGYQDAVKANRGLSLPSLRNNSRHWNHLDSAPSSGLNTCLPAPPTHRQRTRSIVATVQSSRDHLTVSEPSQLSQSAPSIMEPLQSSNPMMQARAHIQNRLGSQDNVNEQKGLPQAPHPRTPKLLAPLASRRREIVPLPGLKHQVPLKPISRSPLCSRSQLRRERLSWGSPRSGPGPLINKGGSEESGSSSSQSSVDLEDDPEDDERDAYRRVTSVGLLQHSSNVNFCGAALVGKVCQDYGVEPPSHVPQIHRSAQDLGREPINRSSDKNSYCEGKASHIKYATKPLDSQTLTDFAPPGDTMNPTQDSSRKELPITSKCKVEKTKVGNTTEPKRSVSRMRTVDNDRSDTSIGSQGNERNDKGTRDSGCEEAMEDNVTKVVVKLDPKTTKERFQRCTAPPKVDHKRDERLISFKHAQTRLTKCSIKYEVGENSQMNAQSLTTAHRETEEKDQRNAHLIKTKGNLKNFLFSPQARAKTGKSNELIISGETVTKVKSKLKCVKGSHDNSSTPSPRNKLSDHPQSRNANPDKLKGNMAQRHKTSIEPKSPRQLKRSGLEGKPRSKSAVDCITYKDMFQQIQSGDKGPVIYEMFAGPVYENLRVSSSCEKGKDRQVQSAPPRKTQRVKQRPMRQAHGKIRKSLAESTVVLAKSKPQLASPRVKGRLTQVLNKGKHRLENLPDKHREAEFFPSKDIDSCQNAAQAKAEGLMLNTIEEDVSRYGPDGKSSTASCDYSRVHLNMQETNENVPTENGNQPVSQPASSQNPQQPKMSTWTSSSRGSHTIVSPVYQKFLDEVGDGPLTDDLLQCLAEELISLDERDGSTGSCPEDVEPSEEERNDENDPRSGRNSFSKVGPTEGAAFLGSGMIVDDTITWKRGEVLGRGAYGTVYCGLTNQGQLIAVKQVGLDSSDPLAAKKEYSRLQGEVDLLKTLRHTNIVGFMGTSLNQHVVSIFMEYIPGGSIASILHRFGPLPERVLALYTHQILEGVTYLHMNRVIHRDLKGNNVMLMPTGVIKLIDFGCARRITCLNHTSSNNRDLIKSVHGTPYWMAPEVINETGHGRKSDIWSVGCTVFEMATGKPPLAHMDKMAALFYIGAQRGLMPSLPDGFSENVRDFVKICLTGDQRLRPSADQLLKHSFIQQNETGMNSWKSQKKNCCGHLGLCG